VTAPRDPFAGHTPGRRDPRGECRRITSVLVDPNGGPTIVGYNCGHYSPHNQIFSYRVNDDSRCLSCGADLHAADLLRERDEARANAASLAMQLNRALCRLHQPDEGWEPVADALAVDMEAVQADNTTLRARVGRLETALREADDAVAALGAFAVERENTEAITNGWPIKCAEQTRVAIAAALATPTEEPTR